MTVDPAREQLYAAIVNVVHDADEGSAYWQIADAILAAGQIVGTRHLASNPADYTHVTVEFDLAAVRAAAYRLAAREAAGRG